MELFPLTLSLKAALLSLLFICPVGSVAACWLAFGRPFPGKILLESLVLLPLVLPPTAVGYLLLLIFGEGSGFGYWLNNTLNIRLLFQPASIVIADICMGMPLFIKAAEAAFRSVDRDLLEAANTQGAGWPFIFVKVLLPLSYRGLFAGIALAFARAMGEFGAAMMIGGSIPGRTETLPIALYDAVQAGRDRDALIYSLALSAASLVLLAGLRVYEKRTAWQH